MGVTREAQQEVGELPPALFAPKRRTTSKERSKTITNVPAIIVTPRTLVHSEEVPRKPGDSRNWAKEELKRLWSEGRVDYMPFEAVGTGQAAYAFYVPEQNVGSGKTALEWANGIGIWGYASRLYIEEHRLPEDGHTVRIGKIVVTGG